MSYELCGKVISRRPTAGQPIDVGRLASLGVTDSTEQEQAAELARQVEALRDQGMPIFRAVQQYMEHARAVEAGVASVARQISDAMDSGMTEVIAAAQKLVPRPPGASLSGTGTLSAGGRIAGGASLSGEGRLVASADVITLYDSDSVQPENLSRLSARASRDGLAGLSTMQILVLVLICLLAVGAPFAQLELPPEAQVLLTEEYSTLSLGLAIALVIVQNRKS
jgi:hypothetical protein